MTTLSFVGLYPPPVRSMQRAGSKLRNWTKNPITHYRSYNSSNTFMNLFRMQYVWMPLPQPQALCNITRATHEIHFYSSWLCIVELRKISTILADYLA